MKKRRLGSSGISVNPIGLGAMPLSTVNRPTSQQAIHLICEALDAGIDFIDTVSNEGSIYSKGTSTITSRVFTNAGDFSSDGDMALTVGTGGVDNSGTIQSNTHLTMESQTGIDNTGDILAIQSATITAAESVVNNGGRIKANEGLSVTSKTGDIENTLGGTVSSGGDLTLMAKITILNQDDDSEIASDGDLSLNAATFENKIGSWEDKANHLLEEFGKTKIDDTKLLGILSSDRNALYLGMS